MKKGFTYLLIAVVLSLFFLYSCDEVVVNNVPIKQAYMGTITDPQGNAVPNAFVEILVPVGVINNNNEDILASDTTDDNGVFEFNEISLPMDKALMRISHSNFQKYEKLLSEVIKDKDPKKLPVQLLFTDSCCGTVTIIIKKASDSVTTMNDVQIKLRKNGTLYRTSYTNSNGQITWENVCLNSYGIRIAKDGYKVIEKEINIANCDSNYVFTYYMQQNESTPTDTCCNNIIKVWAKDSGNNNLNGATVKIRKNGVLLTYKVTENGEPAVFREICKGEYSFLILKEGYQSVEFSAVVDCLDTLNITKTMTADTCCKGYAKVFVKDSSNNESLNGATVKLYKGSALKQTATVTNGYVLFGPYCEGTYAIDVLKENYRHSELSITISCNQTTEFTKKLLAETDTCCKGYAKVFIKDSTNNNALNGATVKLWQNGAVKTYKTVENGYVLFGPYCEGTYGISVLKDGYKTGEMNISIECNDTTEFTKKLLSNTTTDTCCNGVYILYAKDSTTNAAINGATVYLYKGSTKIKATSTNDQGKVVFTGLCNGDGYSISMSKSGYKSIEWGFGLDCNDTVEVTKKMLSNSTQDTCCTGKLYLTIKNGDGVAISGATVQLKVDGVLKYSATSNDNGLASIDGICAPKTYNVRIVKDGYVVKEFTLTYNECNTKTETISLATGTCCTAKLKVQVKNSEGTILSGVTVKVRLEGAVIKEGTTNADGYVVFESLCAPKTYSVLFTKDTYNNKEVNYVYTDCTTKIESVVMTK